ncbi:MAG: D-arabinono-1,4-lactone oxidase [Bdellovibrionales bacterium]
MANRTINKKLEDQRFKSLAKSPPPYLSLKDGKLKASQGVVGNSYQMLVSKNIELNPSYTGRDYSFAFAMEDAPEVMNFIHQFSKSNGFYHPFSGLFLRFAKSSELAFLSHIERSDKKAGEVYVLAEFFELKEYVTNPKETVFSQLAMQLLSELAEKKLITFHWGKNTNTIFSFKSNKNLLNPGAQSFESIRKEMDPKGLFLNEFVKKYLLENY